MRIKANECKILHMGHIIFSEYYNDHSKILKIDIEDNILFVRLLTDKRDNFDKDIYETLYSIPLTSILYIKTENNKSKIILKD